MYCTKCGSKIDDSAVFCTACGNKVEKNKIKGGKALMAATTLLICVIVLFGVILGGNQTKISQEDRPEVVKEENIVQKQEENNIVKQKEELVSKEEKELFQSRNVEMKRISSEYANLSIEPAMYVGTLCEGYCSESNEYIDDVYYLWLKKTEDVEYVSANGEIKTIATKGMILEGDNWDPLVGEEVICYGKATRSTYNEVEVSFIPAVILPMEKELKNSTYMDRPNSVDNSKSVFLENIISSYKNMLQPYLIRPEEIVLQSTLETEYGALDNTVELYGGYMLEDLDNDDVPEMILPGMLNQYCVLFIVNPGLEISVVPGEFLYNVPNKNLFYTAEGYDDYIFYACWYRERHGGIYGNKGDESFTYMKAFENSRDMNGNYVGYDYSNVILGQNVMREESNNISEKLDELFNLVEMPISYDYTDLSPFNNY